MNRSAWILLLCSAALAPAPARAHGGVRHDFLLIHGRWWDGSRFVVRDRTYTVGGMLRDAYEGAVEDTIDLSGRYVLPPFADAHTHLLSDTTGIVRDLRFLLGAGVLFAQNPNSPASRIGAVRARLAQPGTLEMRFSGGGITSPGGHPAQIYDPEGAHGTRSWADDAYVEVADEASLRAKWPMILTPKPDFIKAYLERSELPLAGQQASYGRHGLDPKLLPIVVQLAHAAKLPVAVHVTSSADFHAAVSAGADEIAHLPLEPISDADAAEAARRGTTVVTTVLSHRPTTGVTDVAALQRENIRRLRQAKVRLVLGTDNPRMTAADEAIELCKIGACTTAQAIGLLTQATVSYLAPARKLAARIGDEASFVVLEADPLADVGNLKKVAWSMKQGYHVELPALTGKPAVADTLLGLLIQGKVDEALALHERLRRERPHDFDFGEQQLNSLGYGMIRHGALAGAIPLFRRNAELFPASGNAFDSLAEGYLAVGDSVRAAEAYENVLRVLEAHPEYAPPARAALTERARRFLAVRGRQP